MIEKTPTTVSRRRLLELMGLGAMTAAVASNSNETFAQEKDKYQQIKEIANSEGIVTSEVEMLRLLSKPESEKPLIIDVRHNEDLANNKNALIFPSSNNVLKIINDIADPRAGIAFMLGRGDLTFNPEINFKLNREGSQLIDPDEVKKIIISRLKNNLKRQIVVVCEAGIRSAYAAVILKKYYGFDNVKTLDNGIGNIESETLKAALLTTGRQLSSL